MLAGFTGTFDVLLVEALASSTGFSLKLQSEGNKSHQKVKVKYMAGGSISHDTGGKS